MADDIDKVLIQLVSEAPILYDRTQEEYRNNNLKNTAWRDILYKLSNMGFRNNLKDIGQVQKKWKGLRDYYFKILREESHKDGTNRKLRKTWIHMRSMRFLKDQNKFESVNGNRDSPSSPADVSSDCDDTLPGEKSRSCTPIISITTDHEYADSRSDVDSEFNRRGTQKRPHSDDISAVLLKSLCVRDAVLKKLITDKPFEKMSVEKSFGNFVHASLSEVKDDELRKDKMRKIANILLS